MKTLNIVFKNNQKHPFHLVDPSPWAFIAAVGAFCMTLGFAMYAHQFSGGFACFLTGFISILYVMFVWWRDIIRESTYEGQHTESVQLGMRWGMLLFIVSEIMFFFAFFWAFFATSLSPAHDIGGIYPPNGVDVISPWEVPLVNTLILLLSGATVTWSHGEIIAGFRKPAIVGLIFTVILATIFTSLQVFEYFTAPFSISDGIYGSTFFLATGFHGFHVFIGTCFLIICASRLYNNHFTQEHHFGFEAAAWYWHFVDVVWLFLFITIYWWAS
jgi:cytochrome c oxidase subunit 3